MEIVLTVRSSDGKGAYPVRFQLGEGDVVAVCGCRAGAFGRICKHLIGLLRGEADLLLDSAQLSSLEELQVFVRTTRIGILLDELAAAENALNVARGRVEKAKKALEHLVARTNL